MKVNDGELNLRVAYSNFPPFVIANGSNGSLVLNGFMADILKTVAMWMSISLTFIREPEDLYGTWENNTWTGMVGMLYRNEVDLILNPIMANSPNLEFAYFTNPITIEAFTILSGKKTEEASIFLYLSVLDTKVWCAIIVTAIVVAGTSALLFTSLASVQQFTWIKMSGEYFWVLLSYMLQQNPSEKYLLRQSKRNISVFLPLMIMLWIVSVGLLIMTVFESLLVSKLTIRKSSPFVDTMEDLLHTDETLGTAPVEIQIEEVLENSGIEVYEKTWKKIKPNLMPGSQVLSDEMLEDVQRGKFCIFHGHLVLESRLSEFYKENSFCQMHLSEQHFFPFPLVMAMQRQLSSTIFEHFNFGVTRLVDADIVGRQAKEALEVSKQCTSYSDNELKPMSLENVYGVFLLWATGITAGVVVLACEIIYKKIILM